MSKEKTLCLTSDLVQPQGMTPLALIHRDWADSVDSGSYMKRQWLSCFYVQKMIRDCNPALPEQVSRHLISVHEHQKQLLESFLGKQPDPEEIPPSFYVQRLDEKLFQGHTPVSVAGSLMSLALMYTRGALRYVELAKHKWPSPLWATLIGEAYSNATVCITALKRMPGIDLLSEWAIAVEKETEVMTEIYKHNGLKA